MKAITVRMPDDLKAKLEACVNHKLSQNTIILKALTEFLGKK
jgi:predicted transcriptional regulator